MSKKTEQQLIAEAMSQSLPKLSRDKIARELLRGVPKEGKADHERIASAIRSGKHFDSIMKMPEVDSWPETDNWLRSHKEALSD